MNSALKDCCVKSVEDRFRCDVIKSLTINTYTVSCNSFVRKSAHSVTDFVIRGR
jgi:hypothetical protein